MIKSHGGIGELRSRIQLYTFTRQADADFGFEETSEKLASVWAKAEQIAPKSYVDNATMDERNPATQQFMIRHKPGLTEDRLKANTYAVWEGRRFQIMSVRRLDQRGDYLVLYCAPQEKPAAPAPVSVEPVD